MTGLTIGPGLTLPLEAVTETFAILAKRGSGKTYTAAVLVEELYAAGLPVVVVDPVGVWWGLRSSADGTGPGLPFVVFGGDHADVPLEATAGELIADLVVDERVPAVLDLSGLSKTAARRFMTDFAERLYHRNRDPLHLVLDEADAFAPQRTSADGARLLGAIEDLVRRGRARGIGVTLITQRPAVLNKDVLTQAEVLVALRMTGPRDVAAIDEWVRLHADEDQAAELKKSLPALPVGTAWVWSPGWLGILQRVQVRRRRTFDSSATPKPGERRPAPKRMAPVDLAALGERIAATVERAKADDPKALRARVAQLEQQLADAVSLPPQVEVQRVEVPVITAEQMATLKNDIAPAIWKMSAALRDLVIAGNEQTPAPELRSTAAGSARGEVAGTGRAARAAAQPSPTPPTVRSATTPVPASPDAPLPKAQRAILTVLAQHGRRTTQQVALLTAYSGKSGGFRNALSSLRTAGYIEGRGDVTITDTGRAALGTWTPLPTGRALVDWWCGQLGKAEKAILLLAVDVHPYPVAVAEVAARTGYSASSGGFRNALSRLRTLELIAGRGEIRANDMLATP
jgi:uncharacterized protein